MASLEKSKTSSSGKLPIIPSISCDFPLLFFFFALFSLLFSHFICSVERLDPLLSSSEAASTPSAPSSPFVLTLESAVSRALNCNRQLLGAVENLTQAQYGIDLAESEFNVTLKPQSQAGYYGKDRGKPKWRAGGGVDIAKKLTTGTLISIVPSIVKMRREYMTEIEAEVVQPLFRGNGKEYQLAALRGAQFALRTAYRDLKIAQSQLAMRTIRALYEIAKLERAHLLNRESMERIGRFYQAALLKEKIGMSDVLDTYRAQIEHRLAEDALKNTDEHLEEAKDSLRDLLALPLDIPLHVVVPLHFSPHPADRDLAIEYALRCRIEVEQAQDDKRESERLTKLAKKNLYPELNLVLNYSNAGRGRNFSSSCTKGRENAWGIGVATSSIADPLHDQIAYEQSLQAIETAARGTDQTESSLILDVKKAVRQLDRALERIHLQERQIKTAQAELHLAQIKFNRGMADNFNVMQAEKILALAEQTRWSALIDHIVGEFQLLAAMGLLL